MLYTVLQNINHDFMVSIPHSSFLRMFATKNRLILMFLRQDFSRFLPRFHLSILFTLKKTDSKIN